MEVRELLSDYEFPGDEIPVISGSASRLSSAAAARTTANGAPRSSPSPRPSTSTCPSRARRRQPFLMPVEDVFTITGRGTVATGRVERGKVKVGEEVA